MARIILSLCVMLLVPLANVAAQEAPETRPEAGLDSSSDTTGTEGKQKDRDWYPDPNQSRTFVFPTGSTVPSGEFSYENYYLFLNNVQYGIIDQAMFSLGVVPLPEEAAIITFGPKVRVYQHPTKKFEAAVGGHVYIGTDGDETITLFVPYGAMSYGNPDMGRLHVGAGGLIIEDERAFMFNLSGDIRVMKRIKLMGEMFVVSADQETHAFPIYGLRLVGQKSSVDFGFIKVLDEDNLTPLGWPLIKYVRQF